VKICFVELSAEKQIGGLSAAISSLRRALEDQNFSVVDQNEFLRAPEKVDLVHFHGLWDLRHSGLSQSCRQRNIPYIVSPHGMLEPWAWRHKRWKKLPYFYLRERGHLAGAKALLATGADEARRLHEFFSRRKTVALPLGLTGDARPDYPAAREKFGWRDDERVLLFLSRIHPKKGLDLLLRALCGIREARLVIVGGGDAKYVSELRDFCKKNAADLPRVDWIGEIWGEARWPYFQGVDLFCLPSHSENFGIAVLEACQVGTPALTTTATPWAEELRDDRGFICEPETRSIRRALDRFFLKPVVSIEERQKLSDWAWAKFHWSVLAPRYVEFYEKLSER
jgi:glycosyltransferase involved in cell wall biosynthesis